MFARRFQVDVLDPVPPRPCPLAWLDSFAMRSFTGRSSFDDVLPAGEGRIEVGFGVDLDALRADMEDWLTRKFGQGRPVHLGFSEIPARDQRDRSAAT